MTEINTNLLFKNQNLSKFEITENFTCIRFLDHNKERFELEFNLEKGTSHNTFLIRNNKDLFIIHPPEKQYFKLFNEIISNIFNQKSIKRGSFFEIKLKFKSFFILINKSDTSKIFSNFKF